MWQLKKFLARICPNTATFPASGEGRGADVHEKEVNKKKQEPQFSKNKYSVVIKFVDKQTYWLPS